MTDAVVRLLYVDDDVALVRLVQKILGRRGFEVVHAASGEEALARLAEGGIDVVALDHYLAGETGIELLGRFGQVESPPAVVYVTGAAETDIAVAALKAGASDFVYRPFVAEELQCRIANNVETLTQMKQLRAAAACDYLTGLYNRRYFYDNGPKLVNECLRQKAASSVAIRDASNT